MMVQRLVAGWASLECELALRQSNNQNDTHYISGNQCNHIIPSRLLGQGVHIIIILWPRVFASLQGAMTNHTLWHDGWQIDQVFTSPVFFLLFYMAVICVYWNAVSLLCTVLGCQRQSKIQS